LWTEVALWKTRELVHRSLGPIILAALRHDKVPLPVTETAQVFPVPGRFDEARQIIHAAQARNSDDFRLHQTLYALAFLGADSAAMAEQQQWFAGKPEFENFGLALASDTEAYGGHLGKARELTKRAVDSAIRADSKETAAIWQANAALQQAAYGDATQSPAVSCTGFAACSHESGGRSRSRACVCHGK
jgi:hypothetical protein